MIRILTEADKEIVSSMETGIEDDYVIRIFLKLVEEDCVIGYFQDQMLVGIAGVTIFESEAAVLGRLRTHRNFQGQGIATMLMNRLKNDAFLEPGVTWTGYATERNNVPGNRLAKHLQMDLEASLVSSRISPGDVVGWNEELSFQHESSREEKRKCLIENDQCRKLSFFPYSIYYPLPYAPHLSHTYVDSLEMYRSDAGSFFLMKEEKGASYLNIKVWDEQVLYSKSMWEIVNEQAEQEARLIWVDLPSNLARSFEAKSHQTVWNLYGQTRS
ncbi:GNAT family N-acetyltransferase [Pseudalkalibacillus hwajinpoensis]|uniref:GNAT family N-acetyltransferase n=1 Tax=Guptibacillus hwajinpoensis TaxID=208199 RepID=UPI00325B39C1